MNKIYGDLDQVNSGSVLTVPHVERPAVPPFSGAAVVKLHRLYSGQPRPVSVVQLVCSATEGVVKGPWM